MLQRWGAPALIVLLIGSFAAGCAAARTGAEAGGAPATAGAAASADTKGPLPAGRDWQRAVISYGPLATEVSDAAVVSGWGDWLSERTPAGTAAFSGTTGPVLQLTDSGGETFAVTVLDSWTVGDGRFWDSGPGVPPSYSRWGIWSEVTAALLAPASLAAYVEQGEAWIVAHDRGMRANLTPAQQQALAAWLRETVVSDGGCPSGPPLYPHLELVVDHVPVLVLARPTDGFSPDWASHSAYCARYDVPDGLYDFAASLFPPEQPEWSSFRSLFGADEVLVMKRGREPWTTGPPSWRGDALVRVFLQAVPVDESELADASAEPDFLFSFRHGDAVSEVSVTGEIVTYAGRSYRLPLTVEQLESLLSAD